MTDILKATAKKRSKDVSEEKFLSGLYVIAISDKKHNYIGNNMQLCRNLSTLQLFSN